MKAREKGALIIGVVLIGIGALAFAGVLAANSFDISRFAQRASYVRTEVEPEGEFDRVEVDCVTADVMLLPSQDGKCSVYYDEDGMGSYTVEVSDGTLRIRKEDKWYDHILNIKLARPEVAVYLPEAEYRALSVETVSGKVGIEGLCAEEVSARTTSGSICIAEVDAGQVAVCSTSGGIQLNAVRAENLSAKNTSGAVSLTDFAATGLAKVGTVSGAIRLEGADAAAFELTSVSGSIRGTLNSDMRFDVHSVSGGITVPDSVESGGSFSASTTSGRIEIAVGG